MGVATTAGLDATTTTIASNANALTSSAPEFTVTAGTFSFAANGMVGTAAATTYKAVASGHRGFDITWRYTVTATSTGDGIYFDIYPTQALASSTAGSPGSGIRFQMNNQTFYVVDGGASGTILFTSGTVPLNTPYEFRAVMSEAGYLTLTVRDTSTGLVTLALDALDYTAKAFWTTASTRPYLRIYQNQTTFRVSALLEASRPAAEIVRAPRNGLVQLSDGTSVWVENAPTGTTSTTITVWRDPKGSSAPVQLASWTLAYRLCCPSLICRDSSDNLYVASAMAAAGVEFRSLTKASGAWTLNKTAVASDSNSYYLRALTWASTGYVYIDFLYSGNSKEYLQGWSVTNINAGSAASVGLNQANTLSTSSFSRRAALSMDALDASTTTGLWGFWYSATVLYLYRATYSGATLTTNTVTQLTLANPATVSIVRVATAKWVLTTLDASQKLIAYVITATGTGTGAALTVSAAYTSTATITGDVQRGFGDAAFDGTYVDQIMPSDYGASPAVTDYVAARFNVATVTWVAPAAFAAMAGQAKEETAHVATGPLTLSPETTRADGAIDWLITSLGASSAAASSSRTVHSSGNFAVTTLAGVVRNADGSVYTGGAPIDVLSSGGLVVASTTSSTSDGTWTVTLPNGAALYEVVAFSADATQTAATALRVTA